VNNPFMTGHLRDGLGGEIYGNLLLDARAETSQIGSPEEVELGNEKGMTPTAANGDGADLYPASPATPT
jgi:hypothetical protein